MTFQDLFLRSQNPDCLEQILSFLTCKDLANTARTCKELKHIIFDHDKIDVIWQGAEAGLTKPSDRQPIEAEGFEDMPRVGSNARHHCQLFVAASKAAKEYLYSRDPSRYHKIINVDGVLADLMHVRGFDAESIANRTATARDEEAVAEYKERWEEMKKVAEPTKTYHHRIFVRITNTATGFLISEGFCCNRQVHPWFAGLDFPIPNCSYNQKEKQCLEIPLNFQSLRESREVERFRRALGEEWWTIENDEASKVRGIPIDVTIVVIDLRNQGTRCLFLPVSTAFDGPLRLPRKVEKANGPFDRYLKFGFPAAINSVAKPVRLGPSSLRDRYLLSYSLSLKVTTRSDGYTIILPVFTIYVEKLRN